MTGTLKLGSGVVIALVVFAVVGPHIGRGSVTALSGTPFAGPSPAHWFGTDNLGRDTFTRLAVATGSTLLISFVSAVVAMIIGTALGVIAGYGGRIADTIVMRGVDLALAIPAILLALVVRVVSGPGVFPLIVAISVISAPLFARVVRGPVRLLRERDFVAAAEVAGVGRANIALRHLVPNSVTPIAIQLANTASLAVLLEASLSYLGQGVQAPQPSAGRMISEFQRYLSDEPQLVLLPATLIVLITVGWNLIADGVQKRSTPTRKDPR
jgi:ABC-type dipeptide/oligopeptide/nickel transport system permease subunit